MSKLKISDYKNNYPLPPNQFKICLELVGEAIKITSDKDIQLKTRENFNHHRVETKIKWAADLLIDSIELSTK